MKKYLTLISVTAIAITAMFQMAIAAPNKGPTDDRPSLLNKVRDEVKVRKENADNNQEMRINRLENRLIGSSTNGSSTYPNRFATSTPPRRGPNAMGTTSTSSMNRYADKAKQKMFEHIFNIEKRNVYRQLTLAINNIKQVRERVESRIEKAEASGRDMSKAKSLLTIADGKITLAEKAVEAIVNLNATSTTASSTATSTIDLTRPRLVANEAKRAIKDAQRALNEVVVTIAKAMGFKIGLDGRIVPPLPIHPKPPTATSTATSTNATSTTATSTATSTNATSTNATSTNATSTEATTTASTTTQ